MKYRMLLVMFLVSGLAMADSYLTVKELLVSCEEYINQSGGVHDDNYCAEYIPKIEELYTGDYKTWCLPADLEGGEMVLTVIKYLQNDPDNDFGVASSNVVKALTVSYPCD